MIDIAKESISIDCPTCNRKIQVAIGQIAKNAHVKCRCGQGIELHDDGGTNRDSIKRINASFKSLENTIKRFGR